jgi:RHS repeat-associated protein
MNKRFASIVVFTLCGLLAFGPILASASDLNARSKAFGLNGSTRLFPSRNVPGHPEPRNPFKTVKAGKQNLDRDEDFKSLAEGQTATRLPDGRWLLIGGMGPDGPLARIEIQDPLSTKTMALSCTLGRARAWHSATLLPDGSVMVYGGVAANDRILQDAELLVPEKQICEQLGASKLLPRAYHTATLLTDGRVLFAGGISRGGGTLRVAEIWDPGLKTSSTVSGQSVGRRRHGATLLPDGRVMLTNGKDDNNNELFDAEAYNPETQSFTYEGGYTPFNDPNGPYTVASLPKDGSTDVPVESRIALRFSKPLRAQSVTAETITLTGEQGVVPAKVIPAEGGRLAFVTPKENLLSGATYTLSMGGSTDYLGQTLPVSVVTFTTKSEDPKNEESSADEDWTPDANNLRGDWRSHRHSPEQERPRLQAPPGVTALSGQTLAMNGRALPGVTVKVGSTMTVTDATGRFLLMTVSTGHQVMVVDGRTASRRGTTYGVFKIGVDIVGGQTNVLSYTTWMPKLDTAHAVTLSVPTATEIVVTTRKIPGLEVHIPAGATVRDIDGQTASQISITPIPVDQTPFPLPANTIVPVFFTVQPGAAHILPPRVRVIYPNYTNQKAGTRMNFWNYDPERRGWYVYGHGSVTADGRQVVPDPGVVIYEFTGFMIGNGGGAPPKGPKPGGGPEGTGGDPVDLSTGLFVYNKTDLVALDTVSIGVNRTYRQGDSISRAFGIGASLSYDMYLTSDNDYQDADLVLADGGRVHYVRTSPGTGFTDAIYEHTSTPSVFQESRLYWNGAGWDIKLKDGTILGFNDSGPGGASNLVISISDRYGNKISINRTNNATSRITSPNGRWIDLTYDASNRITQVTDNIGRTVAYGYDPAGRLATVTDAKGGITTYTYDDSNQMLTIKDPRNITYLTNEYDLNGRVSKQTQADTGTFLFAYTTDVNGNVTQTDVTDPRNNVRRVTFNESGYILTDCDALNKPEQQTTIYERDPTTNFPLSVTDPLGRRTNYSYDSVGNLTSVTYLAGTAAAVTGLFTYETRYNQLATYTDPLNHTRSFTYDENGNLNSTTDALSHRTAMSYNGKGQPVSVTDALNNTMRFTYDLADLSSITDPAGRRVTRFTDETGRPIAVTDTVGRTAQFEYDASNQVTRVTDALNNPTLFAYDPNGNLLSVTDSQGNVTSYTYDNMDRLQTRSDALQGVNSVEHYEYDLAGNLTKFTDRRGKVTSYSYDNLNRLVFIGYGTTVNGEVSSYESTVTQTYDSANRLLQAVDSASGTITRTYDDQARTRSETTPQGVVTYTCDVVGRMSAKNVSGQAAASYSYDNADRLTGITQGSANMGIAYDDANRRTSLTLPNGISVAYGYDNASQLTSLTYRKGSEVLGDLQYQYDQLGRRTRTGGTFARTNLPQPLISNVFNAKNQLTEQGTQALTYDANGNLTADGVNTYTWNARNQLVAIDGNVSASFQYDAFGRRTSKTINGDTVAYLYDGVNVVQEQAAGSPTANLLTGGVDHVFSRSDVGGIKTLLSGGQDSTLAITNAAGSVETEYTYDPFGNTTASGTVSGNSTQYTGRENDGTGLYYYRNRYYSPTLQRFISEDPIGLAGGLNVYEYTGNNPITRTDPFGTDWTWTVLCYAAHISAGFGDTVSFGGTKWIRSYTPARKTIDTSSGAYAGGQAGGVVWHVALMVATAGGSATLETEEVGVGLATRAQEIHQVLDPIAQARRTTAVLEAVDEAGNVRTIVASSERTLSVAQRAALNPGEIAATGAGHAEVTALNAAQASGLTPIAIGASRAFCPACAIAIRAAGIGGP